MGLKPTFGLVSHFGIGFGWDPSLDYVGPLGRTSADVACALEAVAGRDPLDPRQGPETPELLDVLSGLGDGVEGLKIGVLAEGFEGADPEVAAAVESAAGVLGAAGATVKPVSVPAHQQVCLAFRALLPEGHRAVFETGLFGAFGRTYYPAALTAEVHRLWREHPELLNPRTVLARLVAEFGRRAYHGAVYARAQNVRESFARAYDLALQQVDVLLMPTAGTPAPRYEPATLEAVLGSGDRIAGNTQPFNYTGHPALSVPCGRAGGLPVGMQLVGRRYDDPLLLRVAHAFEHSVPYDEIIALPG
jgi:amidase